MTNETTRRAVQRETEIWALGAAVRPKADKSAPWFPGTTALPNRSPGPLPKRDSVRNRQGLEMIDS